MIPPRPRLAVIAGPTASGKSALALALAEKLGGVVINADASQVYADLRVLSARPSPEEEARAPHRLYGVVDGATACSAAMWAGMARAEIEAAHRDGRLPVLVGGSGLYLRTLIEGIAPVPDIPDDIRVGVRGLDVAEAHAALARLDPAMAGRLRPTDRQRVARALEVVCATGRSLAEWQQRNEGGIGAAVELHAFVADLPRDELYARCDRRFDIMIGEGALAEVERLVVRALPAELPVMKALGVPPLAAALRGEVELGDAIEQAKRETRRYAKRQDTWFRNQTPGWQRVGPHEANKVASHIE